jgi:TolB-like protein
MKRTILGLLIGSTLCGCAIFEEGNVEFVLDEPIQNNSPPASLSLQSATPLESSLMFQSQYAAELAHKNQSADETHNAVDDIASVNTINPAKHNINHYARGLMQDLVANLQYVNEKTPVAVVSFVMLDSDYNQHNLLGNQLAESLIHEVHKFGIPVIDFKTTGFIRITPQGDFAFSKDYTDFTGDLPARYFIGGTLVKHNAGYLVNARIVGVNSKAVVASAQSFIPLSVANAITASNHTNHNAHSNDLPAADSMVKLTKG